jgi:hypothetical protein
VKKTLRENFSRKKEYEAKKMQTRFNYRKSSFHRKKTENITIDLANDIVIGQKLLHIPSQNMGRNKNEIQAKIQKSGTKRRGSNVKQQNVSSKAKKLNKQRARSLDLPKNSDP